MTPRRSTGGRRGLPEVVRRLRQACPYNRRQTPADLVAALEAEIGELKAAIRTGARWEMLDEVGDVLFNIQALIACCEERGFFTEDDVDAHATSKMIGRHAYVFADEDPPDRSQAMAQWQSVKAREKQARVRHRIGVLWAAEVKGLAERHLGDATWLEGLLRPLCAAAGMDWHGCGPGAPAPSGATACLCLSARAVPPCRLEVQSFPVIGTLLVHGLSTGDIRADALHEVLRSSTDPAALYLDLIEFGTEPLHLIGQEESEWTG